MGQSFSGIKKRLEEDLLAESLRGRIKYQITKYRKSHDSSGRVVIYLDGKEIIDGNIFKFYKGYFAELSYLKKINNIPEREFIDNDFINQTVNLNFEDEFECKRMEDGIFDVWQFTDALEFYLNADIEKSLISDNPLVRMLAILDRRVGKRRLKKLSENYLEEAEWLRFFYSVRLDSERIFLNC